MENIKFKFKHNENNSKLDWLDKNFIRTNIKEIIDDSNSEITRDSFNKIIINNFPYLKDKIRILSTTTDLSKNTSYIKSNPTKNKFFNDDNTANILVFAIKIRNDFFVETIWNFITPEAIAFSTAGEKVSISTWLDEDTIIDAINNPGIHINEKPSSENSEGKMKQFKIWSVTESKIIKFLKSKIYLEESKNLVNLPPYTGCDFYRFEQDDLTKYPTFLSRFEMIFTDKKRFVQHKLLDEQELNEQRVLKEHIDRTEDFIASMDWEITEDKTVVEEADKNDGIDIPKLRDFLRKEYIKLNRIDLNDSAVTDPELLIISHIVPVNETMKKDIKPIEKVREIIDIDNCIFIPAGLDKLFDSFKITFDDNWKIIKPNSLSYETLKEVAGKRPEDIKINNKGERSLKYLKQHRELYKKKNNL